MDVALLSRLQFALTAAFHFLFPPLSIGLGVLLVAMEGAHLRTGKPVYHKLSRFWVKVFALIFAIGVATGLVMEFQFGTNWSTYSRFVGDVFGSALAAEALFAFFLESTFLAVLVFGWERVTARVHLFATVMVALGAHMSAVWIIVANSWQQTPAGHVIADGPAGPRAEIADFWTVVFNPSSMQRLSHVIAASWLSGAFLVIGVSAFYLLRRRHEEFACQGLKLALALALVASLGQLVTGHWSALGVSRNQPAKLAAFEAHYPASASAAMYLWGWVDEDDELVRLGVAIPGALSFLVSGDPTQPVTGLAAFDPADRPPVNLVFQTYHLMVAIGVGLIGLTGLAAFLWWRGTLFASRPVLFALAAAALGPQIANQTGWVSAEVGRQPWVVYGLLRTTDAFSPAVSAGEVAASLAMFAIVYALLFALFVVLLARQIQGGPSEDLTPRGGTSS